MTEPVSDTWHVPDASAESLVPFVRETVAPGTTVLTDGWARCWPLAKQGYTHKAVNLTASPDPAHTSLPGVHRVASCRTRRGSRGATSRHRRGG
jgi:hypothetical protein